MSSWLLIGMCVAVLCPSVRAGNGSALPTVFLESLNAVKDTLLGNWESEIHDTRNVLVFPVAVAQEFLLEHVIRLPDGSSEKTQLAKFIGNDTQFPIVLDLPEFTATAFQELAIRSFYNDTLPEMNATIEDPLYFSYEAFKRWSEVQQNSAADDAMKTSHNPFVTVAALRIDSIQSANFTWIDRVNFRISETQSTEIMALRNVGIYDYAEFDYPQLTTCTAAALRLQINDDLSMIFLIPLNVSDANCSSSENLLKIFQDKNPETIHFEPKRMFVSIPTLQVATVVIPTQKLTQMGLLTSEPLNSPKFARSYESAAFIFNPEMPKNAPVPMISRNTPRFHAERSFVVVAVQRENPVPVLFGLIQNPNADSSRK